MREALAFSAELHMNRQANKRKQQLKNQSPSALEDASSNDIEEEEDEDGTADTLTELRDLLRESNDMPVYMEEAVHLKCQLQALEWANKAALILPFTASIAVPPDAFSFEALTAVCAQSLVPSTSTSTSIPTSTSTSTSITHDGKQNGGVESTAVIIGREGKQGLAGHDVLAVIPVPSKNRPRLAEVQRLAKEIKK